jgi:hypothetical protein
LSQSHATSEQCLGQKHYALLTCRKEKTQMKRMSLSLAKAEFRQKARPLVAQSEQGKIVDLFSELTAAAWMEEGDFVLESMQNELVDALSEPIRKVRHDLYPRMYRLRKEQ